MVSVSRSEDGSQEKLNGISAFEEAVHLYGIPAVFNSDQGSQFTSEAFTSRLEKLGVRISMDGKGRQPFLNEVNNATRN